MKWVQVRPGKYKYVSEDDERPEVELDAKEGLPMFITKPPWADAESTINDPHASGDEQAAATDHFMEEREKWTGSGKWARWERSRKQSWADNKPAWKKEQVRKEKEADEKIIKEAMAEI